MNNSTPECCSDLSDLESSDESLIDVDLIVPEDGEEQIERVMLPHIEEVNKLTIMYVINIVLSSY